MANNHSQKNMRGQIKTINFSQLVVRAMAEKNLSPMQLSLQMGQNRNYLYRQLHGDHSIAFILALSHHLNANLLEPYFSLLPEALRKTPQTQLEKEQEEKINLLQQQVAELTKERDIYKSIALK